MSIVPLVRVSKDHPIHDSIVECFLAACYPVFVEPSRTADRYTWFYKNKEGYGVVHTRHGDEYTSTRYYKYCMLEDLNVQG